MLVKNEKSLSPITHSQFLFDITEHIFSNKTKNDKKKKFVNIFFVGKKRYIK